MNASTKSMGRSEGLEYDGANESSQLTRSLLQQESRALLKLAPGRRMSKIRLAIVLFLVFLYTLLSISYIICLRYNVFDLHRWVMYTNKPLPLALLLVLVPIYSEYNKKSIMYTVWILVGITFCLAGDVILMFQVAMPYSKHPVIEEGSEPYNDQSKDAKLFMYGMLCYMIGKCFYALAFTIGVGKEFKFKLLHSIPFYAFGGLLIVLVYSEIGSDFSYLVVYVFVECTMGWRALALTSSFPGSDRSKLLLWLSVVGSALLMAADTLDVYNAYYAPLRGANFVANGIYWAGQLLIALSVPRRLTNSDYWLHQFTYINPFVNS